MWHRASLSLHWSWGKGCTEENSTLGSQRKSYIGGWMPNEMLSAVRTAGRTWSAHRSYDSFYFSQEEKSFFASPHRCTWSNSHQNTVPAVEASYLIGGWQWRMFFDWVKLIYIKLARLQPAEIHSLPLWQTSVRRWSWISASPRVLGHIIQTAGTECH